MIGPRNIYMAIMVAADRGEGIRLTADEVHTLSMDDAISARAATCLEDDDDFWTQTGFSWAAAHRKWRRDRSA